MSILNAMRMFRSSYGHDDLRAIKDVFNACSERERLDCDDLTTVFDLGVFDDDKTPRSACSRYYHVQSIVAQVGLRNIVSAVADYHFDKTAIVIRQILVHPQCRRCSLGSGIIREMKRNSSMSRKNLRVFVPEYQTGTLLFLRMCGFTTKAHDCGKFITTVEAVQQEYIRMEWP